MPVVVWGLVFVLSLAVFISAFWYLDGGSVVSDLVSQATSLLGSDTDETPATGTPASSEPTLTLPPGMPREFALRLWQEQLDSQAMITKLVSGDVTSLTVKSVDVKGNDATLNSVVEFADGATADGVIGMHRFGANWYVAYASAGSAGSGTPGVTSLPAPDEVDIPLLNTIIAQQVKSSAILQEYVDGKVKKVTVERVTSGPNTATVALSMDEDHEEGYADLVAIKQKVAAEDAWFLARFVKTGTDTKN